MGKVRRTVRHVGTGRTNPDLRGHLLLLQDYLDNGFDPLPPDSHDRHLKQGELAAEAKWAREQGEV